MAKIYRFEIFGPRPTLQRMGEVMYKDTPHIHYFERELTDQQYIRVFLYEDQNTTVQNSRCVTCIYSEYASSIQIDLADVGKQSGFRGSQGLEDQPVYDQILDFILDFSKQYGLTVQNKQEV